MKYIFFLALAYCISCSSSSKLNKAYTPPGTVQINDTLFADVTEIANIDWREYLYFIRTYYKNEDQFNIALPDTMVWNTKIYPNLLPFSKYYHRYPAYNFYPVVGISYTQAIDYCKYRTHAVNLLLYKKGKHISSITEHIYDSIPIKYYYRLPTEKEWELIAKGNTASPDGYEFEGFYTDKKGKQYKKHNAIYPAPFKHDSSSITSPAKSFYPNSYKTYNMIGNVAEMVQEPGIAKGGSFKDSVSNCKIAMRQYYLQPQNWLGFRCVAVKL